MVREWYMRRGLQLLVLERAFGEVNPPAFENHLFAAALPLRNAFHSKQNIHQRLFDFVVTCR
jgi:hypothetical protein